VAGAGPGELARVRREDYLDVVGGRPAVAVALLRVLAGQLPVWRLRVHGTAARCAPGL
jgi:hypothetical protein